MDRDRELDEEIRAHLELEVQQNLEAGMSPDEAQHAALRKFGSVALAKEKTRESWRFASLGTVRQDLRYAFRTLRRNPGFTAVAVLSLALGIGANTAIFSLIDAVLLKSLPVERPEELVIVAAFNGNEGRNFSYPMFRQIAARQDVFSGVFATGNVRFLRVRAEGLGDLEATRIQGRVVSTNYFSVLGVRAIRGRTFTAEDEHGVVISHGFWERQFARDVSVPGWRITLNNAVFTVLGVTPRGFFGDSVGVVPDIWVPIAAQPRLMSRNLLEAPTATWFRTMARLKPGVSEQQAEAVLTVLYRQLVQEEVASGLGSRIYRPRRPGELRVGLEPGSKGLAGLRRQFSQPLRLLMAVVGLVLLIACCNVANLLLVRGAARQKEIGIRLAMGAGRLRIVRQLLSESLVLALFGGAVGLFLAFHGVRFLQALVSVQLAIEPDWHALGFTAAISLLTGVFFGLVPALQATSLDVNSALKESGRSQSSGRPRQRLSKALVVSQVALSFVLLIGAGLLVRSLQNFRRFDAGFERANVLLLDVTPDSSAIKAEEFPVLAGQVLERLNALPGVRSASLSAMPPLTGSANTAPVRVPRSRVDPATDGEVRSNWVSPRYFETLGMRLLLGRNFGPQDTATSRKVTIINETLARHYFGEQNPLGKLMYFPKVDARGRYVPFEEAMDQDQAAEIIGVVRDAKYDSLRQTIPRMAFLPWAEGIGFLSSIEIRTAGDPLGLAGPACKAIAEINSNLLVRNVKTLEEQVSTTLKEERLIAKLLSIFGAVAVVLSCVGLYGVMSYSVARRTHEIGIRMALGARPGNMAGMVVRESLLLAALGLAIGLPAALFSTRLIERLLFGLKPTDPATLALAAVSMLLIAGAAGYLPARRASLVDPVVALRQE